MSQYVLQLTVYEHKHLMGDLVHSVCLEAVGSSDGRAEVAEDLLPALPCSVTLRDQLQRNDTCNAISSSVADR